ncbi:roadblock/LC7 domain-containing protein [Streptomyces sp. NPDC059970]|uniref:roadblock/LC7 domain-containing protein n=1 Tax=Streptomyces sp. NPDC059970 TaxID=3347019 RepID=UPI00367C10C0
MPDTVPTSGTTLDGLLAGFLTRTPLTLRVVLVSPDGLKIAYAGEADRAERLAASISGMFSLSRGSVRGGVQQLIVEGDTESLFVMSAGSAAEPTSVGTLLGVVANSEADPGVIGWEMLSLIKSLAEHLSTKARTGMHPGQGR